jgi:hypothetical protein
MFPLDLDVNVSKAMVSYRQEQVRASFPRKITRWFAPEPRRTAPAVSATATPRLADPALVPEPRMPQQEEKYVA